MLRILTSRLRTQQSPMLGKSTGIHWGGDLKSTFGGFPPLVVLHLLIVGFDKQVSSLLQTVPLLELGKSVCGFHVYFY